MNKTELYEDYQLGRCRVCRAYGHILSVADMDSSLYGRWPGRAVVYDVLFAIQIKVEDIAHQRVPAHRQEHHGHQCRQVV